MAHIEVAFDSAMQVGECPLWHKDEGALYWVDILGFAVHRLHLASGLHRRWLMPSEPAAIARCAAGGLVVALRSGFFHLDTKLTDLGQERTAIVAGALTAIAGAPYDTKTARFNDGRVDGAGRFWVGTRSESGGQQDAQMFYLERGTVHLAWSGGMSSANGLAFSPDQRTMYQADTAGHTIRRMDFDVASAKLGPMRVLRQFPGAREADDYLGRPDGAAVDVEGAYWCAMYEGGRLLRLAADGSVLQEVLLPLRCPTMVAFGGPDLRTLFITSASAGRPAAELAEYPLSGRVLSLRVDVAGRTEHVYLP